MTQHHKRELSPLNEVIEWLTNATPDACNKERYNFFSGLEVDVEKLWREYLSECWSSDLRRGTTLPLFSHALLVTGAYLAGSTTMQKSPCTKDTQMSTQKCTRCRRNLPKSAFDFTGTWRRHVCRQCRRGTPPEAVKMSTVEKDAVRASRKAHADAEREVAALRAALAERDAVPEPSGRALAPPAKTTPSGATMGLVLSDWHVGERVTKEESAGLNTYSPEIARARAEATFRNAARLLRGWARDSDVHTLWVGLLGDFITGHIHEENLIRNVMSPVEEAAFATELLTSGLLLLSREFGSRVIVDACVGNHGRLTKKMHSNPVGTNLETYVYGQVARALAAKAPNVAFSVAPAAGVYRELAGGFVLRARHGHEIRYFGGVGGVAVPLSKAVAGWDRARRADLTVVGHLHGLEVSHAGRFIVNGSLVGYNSFAESIRATPEPPRQVAFLVHDERGLSVTAPVWSTESS